MSNLICCVALACGLLAACKSSTLAKTTIVDAGHVYELGPRSRTPEILLGYAGIEIGTDDRTTNNGVDIDLGEAIPLGESIHLQVHRPVPVLINGKPVLTAAQTVGEAIRGQGIELYTADLFDPPAEAPLTAGAVISFAPAARLHVSADGKDGLIRTAAQSTGAALADAGISIQGLDTALPAEAQPPADDGQARLARVTEAVLLDQETIPYESVTTHSADLELGLEQVLHPGIAGLAVRIARVVRLDGVERSRQLAQQSVVLESQDRVVARGTKIVEKTGIIDGVNITYWHNPQMYATIYSPCNSGTADGTCSTGTASGRPAGKGVVAVDPSLYASLNGQRLYIPGYGFAVIGDVGGGYIVEQNLGIPRSKWIDLGFDDNNIQDMTGWLSVYFLAPAPATIPDVLP